MHRAGTVQIYACGHDVRHISIACMQSWLKQEALMGVGVLIIIFLIIKEAPISVVRLQVGVVH